MAKAATLEKTETAVPDLPRALSESRLKLVGASGADIQNHFAAVTPQGTPFEHVLEPEFWAHCAYKLRPCDLITVHTDDMTYLGRLYVRSVSAPARDRPNNRATVAKLEYHEFGAAPKDLRGKNHEVRFIGPHLKWCVVSLTDERVLKDGCGTSEEAAQWMRTQVG